MQELAIETLNLSRRFGSQAAVQSLNLQVPQGCVYGFLGPNGAGKTTTIRMLLGLIRPNEGRVRLFGQPLEEKRLSLLGRVGALVETPSLYPHLTGRENLEITRRLVGAWPDQIERVLETVQMTASADRLVRTYSLGMRQRLGLALALLNEPDLLLLDEPTNGLDPAGIHEMRALIRRLPAEFGITVFLSSHLLNEIEQVADRIGIIGAGELLFQGSLDELQQQRQERLVLGVDDPETCLRLLTDSGWVALHNGNHTVIVAACSTEDAGRINAFLLQRGVNIFRLNIERPSLEETFLQITGESTTHKEH